MHPVDDHPVPAGPLAVRWLAWTMQRPRAGSLALARVMLENAGSAQWRDAKLSYHWLDELGNPIVWDGLRTDLLPLVPGTRVEAKASVRAPLPPGSYRLAFDIVLEQRYWFSEVGNVPLELDVDVDSRDASHAVAHLPPEAEPADDWHERVRAAHEQGYAAVGGAIERLKGYEAGGGRNPSFDRPLVCPSLLPPLEPNCEVEGLPAWQPDRSIPWMHAEPWIYDAAIVLKLHGRGRG